MKRLSPAFISIVSLLALSAAAQSRVIVRDSLGLSGLNSTCQLLGCTVNETIDGGLGQVFLVTSNSLTTSSSLINSLLAQPGVVDAEPDLLLQVQQFQMQAPSSLYDTTPVSYYGSTAWDGYVNQPAAQMINLPEAQSEYHNTGAGTVAIIDTGVDPNHPVLQPVLLSGYDFTRNQDGGSEISDVSQYSMAVVNQYSMAVVNQYSMAVVNQDETSTLQQSSLSDFGHGTMVAGIVHLVAPTAKILPLKAFQADGSGYLSDVLRAIYYAVQHDAQVVNMSFDFPSSSTELKKALDFAAAHNVVSVASAGNDGANTLVYPAAYSSDVLGIASVSNSQALSSFSNYGQDVFAAAPGEGIVTTYPLSSYAAGWGTSFSAPFFSGAAALLIGAEADVNQTYASQALANATSGAANLGHGILNLEAALQAWLAAH